MKIIEQDGGLWQVWDKTGYCLGFIFDGGAKGSGEPRTKTDEYETLLGWDNNLVGNYRLNGYLGSHRTFMGAVGGLFRWRLKELHTYEK